MNRYIGELILVSRSALIGVHFVQYNMHHTTVITLLPQLVRDTVLAVLQMLLYYGDTSHGREALAIILLIGRKHSISNCFGGGGAQSYTRYEYSFSCCVE